MMKEKNRKQENWKNRSIFPKPECVRCGEDVAGAQGPCLSCWEAGSLPRRSLESPVICEQRSVVITFAF